MINKKISERLGGLNSAKIFLYSINFEEFIPPVNPDEWGGKAIILSGIAQKLETAGADCIVICSNTPHMVADEVQQEIGIPLIHIASAAADEIAGRKIKKVALLGTRITMEQDFFKNKLRQKKIDVFVPGEADRQFIHNAVFDELGKGIFSVKTKKRFLNIINDLIGQGAEGVSTEFPHLIKQEDCPIPIFDTTIIHVNAVVKFALGD
jgi:aspartate racemase